MNTTTDAGASPSTDGRSGSVSATLKIVDAKTFASLKQAA